MSGAARRAVDAMPTATIVNMAPTAGIDEDVAYATVPAPTRPPSPIPS